MNPRRHRPLGQRNQLYGEKLTKIKNADFSVMDTNHRSAGPAFIGTVPCSVNDLGNIGSPAA
jgi:hypothetical protein